MLSLLREEGERGVEGNSERGRREEEEVREGERNSERGWREEEQEMRKRRGWERTLAMKEFLLCSCRITPLRMSSNFGSYSSVGMSGSKLTCG